MRKTILLIVQSALLVIVLACSHSAFAETKAQVKEAPFDKRRLLVQPRNADGTIEVVPFWQDPVLWARDRQQNFYGSMSGALRKIRAEKSFSASLTLALLSFGYGVFHAAGPGHGKAVISAWLLATENQLRRGIIIAFMSAIIQALTAIFIVSFLLLFVNSVGSTAKSVAGFLESASYLLIAAMGVYLLWTGIGPFVMGLMLTPNFQLREMQKRQSGVAPLNSTTSLKS